MRIAKLQSFPKSFLVWFVNYLKVFNKKFALALLFSSRSEKG